MKEINQLAAKDIYVFKYKKKPQNTPNQADPEHPLMGYIPIWNIYFPFV